MKKIVGILSILLLLFGNILFSKTNDKIIVEKGGGFLGGYDRVNEWHFYDEECKCTVHKLSCWDPGTEACRWTNPPRVMRLIDYAEEQISKGVLSGFYEQIIDGVLHTVEWSASDIYNANITETVYDSSTK